MLVFQMLAIPGLRLFLLPTHRPLTLFRDIHGNSVLFTGSPDISSTLCLVQNLIEAASPSLDVGLYLHFFSE